MTLGAFAIPNVVGARDLTQNERDRIIQIVSLDLRDAPTAIFEWPTVEIPETGGDFVEYCGWVNGKNAYGAFAGFVSFSVWLVVQEGEITMIQIPSGPGSGGVPSLDELCVEKGFGRS